MYTPILPSEIGQELRRRNYFLLTEHAVPGIHEEVPGIHEEIPGLHVEPTPHDIPPVPSVHEEPPYIPPIPSVHEEPHPIPPIPSVHEEPPHLVPLPPLDAHHVPHGVIVPEFAEASMWSNVLRFLPLVSLLASERDVLDVMF
jgi:hypothetical protein